MRLESKVKITRLAKYALFAYIFISLFYTSNHYFTSHHRDIQSSTSSSSTAAAAAAAAAAEGREQNARDFLSSYPQEKLSGNKPIGLEKNDNKKAINNNVNVEIHRSDQVTWPGSKGTNK